MRDVKHGDAQKMQAYLFDVSVGIIGGLVAFGLGFTKWQAGCLGLVLWLAALGMQYLYRKAKDQDEAF